MSMGLHDRDYMREMLGKPRRRTLLCRRNLPAILVVVAVIGFFAFQLLSRYMFPTITLTTCAEIKQLEIGGVGL